MSILAEIHSAEVLWQELHEVSKRVHDLPENDRDFEGRAFLMIKMFPGESAKVSAIEMRLQAMSEMISSGKLPGWALPIQKDGSYLIAEPVWVAAAKEPLCMDGDDAHFDERTFVDRVLFYAEPDGTA